MWNKLATKESVEKTIMALKANGVTALFVESGEAAKKKVLEMIPSGAEVMNMTSVTLDTIGLPKELNESGKFNSVRAKLMDEKVSAREKKHLGAAPEWTVGSVHAVTENGKAVIASNTGSQLPAYAYGADHVIWVVGTQKIVKDLDEARKRVYEYVLPLESERAKKAYGVPGSAVNKFLVFNKEVQPERIKMILVGEVVGF
ncbi:MAG: LUD domain-containing protein [Candidatus Taylorbacteria bacterium]|nr:LUD domain-containing protein [Candidatus Taylorbacteria bacterium]